MAPSSEENPEVIVVTDDTTVDDEDAKVVTETPKTKTDFIKAEMTDQLLWYEIPFTTGHPKDVDFKLHVQLLIAITKAFENQEKALIRVHIAMINYSLQHSYASN
jgi:hypothetical protein